MRPCSWFCSRPMGQKTHRALHPYWVWIWMICGKDGVNRENAWYLAYSMSGTEAAEGPDGVKRRRS